jgi:hypothetical protein
MEHLPSSSKDDVSKELRANIMDMLPENPSEDEIKAVLTKMGDPVKLAHEYSQTKHYLIGPKYYDSYIQVLKIVVSIFVCVLVGVSLINIIFNSGNKEIITIIIDFIANIFGSIFQGVSQAFLWVTVSFIIVEKCNVKDKDLPFNEEEWTVNKLKDIKINTSKKISPIESIVGLIFTIIFTTVFYIQPTLIAFYSFKDGVTTSEPLFVISRLNQYMPYIIILALLQLAIFIYKIITKRWSYPLLAVNSGYSILSYVLTAVMFLDKSLYNIEFFNKLGEIFQQSSEKIMSYIWPNAVNGFLVFLAIVIMIEIGQNIYNYVKNK